MAAKKCKAIVRQSKKLAAACKKKVLSGYDLFGPLGTCVGAAQHAQDLANKGGVDRCRAAKSLLSIARSGASMSNKTSRYTRLRDSNGKRRKKPLA